MPKFRPMLPTSKFYGPTPPTPKFQSTPPTSPTLPTPPTTKFDTQHPRTQAPKLPTPPTNPSYPRHPRYLADSSSKTITNTVAISALRNYLRYINSYLRINSPVHQSLRYNNLSSGNVDTWMSSIIL